MKRFAHMKRCLALSLAVLFGGIYASAQAEDAKDSKEDRRAKLQERFDTNKDGKLDENEKAAAQKELGRGGEKRPGDKRPFDLNGTLPPELEKKLLQHFDKNSNGKLDDDEKAAAQEEMKKRREQGGKPGRPGAGGPPDGKLLQHFDKNGDGKLDDTERAAAQEEMKKRREQGGKPGARPEGAKRPEGGKPGEGRPGVEALKARFDADGDGKLSQDEIAKAKAAGAERRKGDAPKKP